MHREMKHERENSIVYNMDNMEFMRGVEDKYYSLALIDPPYGETCKLSGGKAKKDGYADYWDKITEKGNWNVAPTKEYFDEVFRISKEQIIFGANHYPQYLKPSSGWIYWDKGQRNFSFSDGELAYTSFQIKQKTILIHRAQLHEEDRFHPNQKPVKLYDWIYKNYLPNGGKVIDTHLGSGSNRISAHKRGNIIFDACELDVDYFNDGNARFDEFLAKYLPASIEPITKQGQIKLL